MYFHSCISKAFKSRAELRVYRNCMYTVHAVINNGVYLPCAWFILKTLERIFYEGTYIKD